eukprot:3025463-Amphidinium_carterae.1
MRSVLADLARTEHMAGGSMYMWMEALTKARSEMVAREQQYLCCELWWGLEKSGLWQYGAMSLSWCCSMKKQRRTVCDFSLER